MGKCLSIPKVPPPSSLTTNHLAKCNESISPSAVSAGLHACACFDDIQFKAGDDASRCVQLTPACCDSSCSSLPSLDTFSHSIHFIGDHHSATDAAISPLLRPKSTTTLLYAQFTRTLFCEDITYEYVMGCNIKHAPRWVCRLSVESITDFITNVLTKWQQQQHIQTTRLVQIPCQFGKVMPTAVFTSLVTEILQQHGEIFSDAHFGTTAADLFNIPADVCCFMQYSSEQYMHASNAFSTMLYAALDDKYRYLCHHDHTSDSSYWIRSLQHKIDFFVLYARTRCSQVFTIAMSDTAYTIANVLVNEVGVDRHCAWVIADYLPKELSFDDAATGQCSGSQIVYRFEATLATHSSERGTFFLQSDNALLARHPHVNLHELEAWCVSFCEQHMNGLNGLRVTTPTPTLSLSEFIESFSEGLVEDSDHEQEADELPGYLSSNDQKPSDTITWSDYELDDDDDYESEDDDDDDLIDVACYRSFFEDRLLIDSRTLSLNAQQWIDAVLALNLELSEQQISDAFVWMTRLKTEPSVEFMDFLQFSQSSNIDDVDVQCLQHKINDILFTTTRSNDANAC